MDWLVTLTNHSWIFYWLRFSSWNQISLDWVFWLTLYLGQSKLQVPGKGCVAGRDFHFVLPEPLLASDWLIDPNPSPIAHPFCPGGFWIYWSLSKLIQGEQCRCNGESGTWGPALCYFCFCCQLKPRLPLQNFQQLAGAILCLRQIRFTIPLLVLWWHIHFSTLLLYKRRLTQLALHAVWIQLIVYQLIA